MGTHVVPFSNLTGTPCDFARLTFIIWAAGKVPNVKITRGLISSIALSTNGRAMSNSFCDGVRPPGVRQNTIGTMETVLRLSPIAFSILSISSPVAPDKILPDASSSALGTSVRISNRPCPTCGKMVFVAVGRNG